jgi:hypothetical protein
MSTSGTYAFAPNLGEIVINAYARCGIRRTDLTNQHMSDARFEANMMMSDWAGDGINLWQVQSATIPLFQGISAYNIPSDRVFILDVYISQDGFDRLIFPISRSDYASFAQKTLQGYPTSFWYDRLLSPQMYLWPVPDQDDQYTLTYYYMRQAMDNNLTNATQPEVPWYYLDAFGWGLASRLAYIYAPDKVAVLQPRADKSWFRALQVGTENVPVTLNVQMRGYFR